MTTIAENLKIIKDSTADIKQAIIDKGGKVGNLTTYADAIRGIQTGTSSSFWTGHVDVEGLKAIGWDDEDIAYFQEHGVNWMEEDDEYYKVSDDNKALYRVLTSDNIQEYKDRIVWLPKIDFSAKVYAAATFSRCSNMIGLPLIDTSKCVLMMNFFSHCYSLTCIPPLDTSKATSMNGFFDNCHSLSFIPLLNLASCTNIYGMYRECYSLKHIPPFKYGNVTDADFGLLLCVSLESISEQEYCLKNLDYLYSLKDCYFININNNIAFSRSPMLRKKSVLYMIIHEAATEPITITLHAIAYTRLANDPDIVAALSNHPNVSLASA
jgi:hypothetical protein